MFLQTLIHTTFLHKINPEIHLSLHLILNCSPPPLFCSLQFSPSDQSYYLLRYKVRPLARPARKTSNGDWSLTRATSPEQMGRVVYTTKNQLCSWSNMVEMVCFLSWYCSGKYKYRHRRTLLQIFHWIVHLGTFQTTIFRLACSGNRKRLWPCVSYESAL